MSSRGYGEEGRVGKQTKESLDGGGGMCWVFWREEGGGDILSMRSHVGGLQIFPTRGVHPTNRGLFAQTVVSKFTTPQQATLPPS